MKTETPIDPGPELLGELGGRLRRAARRQDVVHDEDPLPRGKRVGVDLETVLAVLETVGHPLRLARQLPRLAGRHDADVELAGERRAEEETRAPRSRGSSPAARRGTARPSPSRRRANAAATRGAASRRERESPATGKSGTSWMYGGSRHRVISNRESALPPAAPRPPRRASTARTERAPLAAARDRFRRRRPHLRRASRRCRPGGCAPSRGPRAPGRRAPRRSGSPLPGRGPARSPGGAVTPGVPAKRPSSGTKVTSSPSSCAKSVLRRRMTRSRCPPAGPDRHDEPAAHGELREQRLGHGLGPGRDEDPVVGRGRRIAVRPVERLDRHVVEPERGQEGRGVPGELVDPLQGIDAAGETGEDGRLVARARADLEDLVLRARRRGAGS